MNGENADFPPEESPEDSDFASFSDESLDWIDAACDHFQAMLGKGEPLSIEAVVATTPAHSRRHLACELVEMEVHYRRHRGEAPVREEYDLRFPHCAELLDRLFAERFATDGSAATHAATGHSPPPDELQIVRLPDAPVSRGSRLGTYEILGFLGRGGMGTVYKARHTRLNRVVAVKVLPAGLLAQKEAVARFEAEVRALGPLDHPNVVRATDADEQSGFHYFVMDYVPGIDLAQLCQQLGPLPAAEACELVRQAAVGLDYLHRQSIVHRDIKPANLMVCTGLAEHGDRDCTRQTACCDQSPLVKILDLGLAQFRQWRQEADRLTCTGQLVGTIDYMAPEQLDDSRDVDVRADIYSLGATLYRLLTGRPPYGDESQLQKLKALATVSPPSVAAQRPDLPAPLVTAIDRMLARDPAARFQAPAEVVEALSSFAQGADLRALMRTVPAPHRAESESSVSTDRRTGASAATVDLPAPQDRLAIKRAMAGAPNRGAKWRQRVPAALSVILLGTIAAAVVIRNFPGGTEDPVPPVPVADPAAGLAPDRPEIPFATPAIAHSDLPLEKIFRGATGPVESLAFNRDGSVLVSGDGGGAVRMWDVDTAVDRCSYVGLEPVWAVAVSPDQQSVAVGTRGRGIAIIRLRDAELTQIVAEDMRHTLGLDWSSDGRWLLASEFSGSVTVCDMERAGESRRLVEQGGRAESVRFSRDAASALTASDRHGLSVWDVPAWTRRVEIANARFVAAISPSGDRVATPGAVFDTATGEAVTRYEPSGYPLEMAFTPDGRHIISCESARLLTVRDAATAQLVARVELNTFGMHALAISPNGKYVVTAGGHAYDPQAREFIDCGDYTIRMWRLPAAVWPDSRMATDHGGQPNRVEPDQGSGPADATTARTLFVDSGQSLGATSSTRIALSDLDGDGDLDGLVAATGSLAIWRNNGTGEFELELLAAEPRNWESVALADLDGDGDPDAVLAAHDAAGQVWWNDGKGDFTDSGQRLDAAGTVSYEVRLADLDGDADVDMFVASAGPNTVWVNDGSGRFAHSREQLGDAVTNDVALADLDGDGDVDAFAANANAASQVWLNDGHGVFRDSGQSLGEVNAGGVALGDLDGDGDIDAFVAKEHGQPDEVWTNDGKGVFTKSATLGGGTSPDVVLGDVDADGDLDALVAHWAAPDSPHPEQTGLVWINQGDGTFRAGQPISDPSVATAAVALGDVDADEDLDAIIINWSSQPDRVLLNQLR